MKAKSNNKNENSPKAAVAALVKDYPWLRYYHLIRWLRAEQIPFTRSGRGNKSSYYVRVEDVRKFILTLKN